MADGIFITFEGIDGCGKSTQLKLLSSWFKEQGREVVIVREPGGTDIGEKIRSILLDKHNDNMCAITELFLYEAARAQIVSEVILPNIKSGKVVLCDRFYDSTFAYQGYARNLGMEMVDTLNNIATGDYAPDITFLLDIDPIKALERRQERGEEFDRLELLGVDFQKKVRDGYLKLAQNKKRIKVVDASLSITQISEKIMKEITVCVAG